MAARLFRVIAISNLVGDEAAARIGARLHVIFENVTDEISLPKYTFD